MSRNAVVTGANRGLGLEFTRQLLARGDRVVATCRQPGKATELNALVGHHPGRLPAAAAAILEAIGVGGGVTVVEHLFVGGFAP